MLRLTTLLWITLLIVAGGTVMRVSYQVRNVQKHLVQVSRDIQREQNTLRVLNAEWNTLNDPNRIEILSKQYLPLERTPIQRVVTLADIPMKPSPEELTLMASVSAKKAAKEKLAKGPVVQVAAPAGPQAPRALVPIALSSSGASPVPQSSPVFIRAER